MIVSNCLRGLIFPIAENRQAGPNFEAGIQCKITFGKREVTNAKIRANHFICKYLFQKIEK